MITQAAGVTPFPPSFVLSANLLRMHSAISFSSLKKVLNSVGPTMDPLSTPMVTGLQLVFVLLFTTL